MSERGSIASVVAAIPGVAAELRRSAARVGPLVLSGAPSLVIELRLALTEGGAPELVGCVGILDLDRPEISDGAAVVYAIRNGPTPADERALRRADRAGIPLLCLIVSPGADDGGGTILPYVLATDVVRAAAVDQAAIDRLAQRLAARAPEQAWALAAELPALRRGVTSALAERSALRSAIVAGATFVPGPDLPAVTVAQIRLVLRLLGARGMRTEGPALAFGVAGALATGLVGRALARSLRRRLPVPPAVVQAAVAYAGTKAIATAVERLPEREAPSEPPGRL